MVICVVVSCTRVWIFTGSDRERKTKGGRVERAGGTSVTPYKGKFRYNVNKTAARGILSFTREYFYSECVTLNWSTLVAYIHIYTCINLEYDNRIKIRVIGKDDFEVIKI
ncbi:hypothetical protein PUN28_000710 [Cardiocondyla obscurior]|uniref:Uncharacterized protein n=1 Tax=Cardiocondyla obscurior TaxID=286306 RepID=A0AAW2H0M6_9HYME